jgi:hypothetical protein
MPTCRYGVTTPAICSEGWIVPDFTTVVATCGPALGEGLAVELDDEEHPAQSRANESVTASKRELATNA